MARPRRIDPRVIEEAQKMASSATTLESLRMAQAVLLPAILNATLEQTASVLGVGRATVHRLQRRLRFLDSAPSQPRTSHGGRRHALMSLEEERAFLAPWEQTSLDGSMLVVSPLRAALSQALGRPVAASVVYRMLERHGWRKVAPDARHLTKWIQTGDDFAINSPENPAKGGKNGKLEKGGGIYSRN